MILYLDSSALVKRYVAEFNAEQVGKVIAQAQLTGTVLIARSK